EPAGAARGGRAGAKRREPRRCPSIRAGAGGLWGRMRAVVQRVTRAEVRVGDEVAGSIGRGLCILVGVGRRDTNVDAERLAAKVVALRVFSDPGGKMNLSVAEVGGKILAISQFTLYGDVRKGNRPSFVLARE